MFDDHLIASGAFDPIFIGMAMCSMKIFIGHHRVTKITISRLFSMVLNVPVQYLLGFELVIADVTLPVHCFGMGRLFVIVNIHHKFITNITLTWWSLMALKMFIQVACPVLFEHLVANWTRKNFFLMLVIVVVVKIFH